MTLMVFSDLSESILGQKLYGISDNIHFSEVRCFRDWGYLYAFHHQL